MKYNELFIATTDTVPGIGAPVNKKNLDEIYEIKNRPRSKGVILMVSTIEMARELKEWTEEAEELANKYWPGATTLVLSDDVAVRMPDKDGLRDLISKVGIIYMTSANKSGKPQLDFEDAIKEFPEIKNHYDFGAGKGKPSTIIDVRTKEILR